MSLPPPLTLVKPLRISSMTHDSIYLSININNQSSMKLQMIALSLRLQKHVLSLCLTLFLLCCGLWSGVYIWTKVENGESLVYLLLEDCECAFVHTIF